jgi:hypothetical protein
VVVFFFFQTKVTKHISNQLRNQGSKQYAGDHRLLVSSLLGIFEQHAFSEKTGPRTLLESFPLTFASTIVKGLNMECVGNFQKRSRSIVPTFEDSGPSAHRDSGLSMLLRIRYSTHCRVSR